jgi:hypothetical protein
MRLLGFKRTTAMILAGTMLALSSGRAAAMLAPATIQADASVRSHDMKTVQSFLEQKAVGQHLASLNLSPSEIESRLASLSDQEIHQVATRINQQQPGRDGSGVVITVLVIGVLALLFVYLLKRV